MTSISSPSRTQSMLDVPAVDNQLPLADQTLKTTPIAVMAQDSQKTEGGKEDPVYIEYGDPDEESHRLDFRDDTIDVFNSVRDHLTQYGSSLLNICSFPSFLSYCLKVRDVGKSSAHAMTDNLADDEDDVYVCHPVHH